MQTQVGNEQVRGVREVGTMNETHLSRSQSGSGLFNTYPSMQREGEGSMWEGVGGEHASLEAIYLARRTDGDPSCGEIVKTLFIHLGDHTFKVTEETRLALLNL